MHRNDVKAVRYPRRMRSTPLALSWLFLFASGGTTPLANASERQLLTEADQLVDIPLVSSATRLLQHRSEAPASITVIDREMIDASGAQEIPDLFRLVPGFQVYQVNGHKFGVSTHSPGEGHPGRLEVMIDGRSVYLAAFSAVDWRSLGVGLSDIDSIEVVRGSNVPTYGSNAFLGAINIITRSAFKDRGSRLVAVGGSGDAARVELNHNDSFGNHGLRLSAGTLQNDGFGIEDAGRGRYVNLRTTSTPTLSDTLELQLGFSQGKAGIGPAFLPIFDRRYSAHYQTLTWSRDLNDADNLRIQAHHNYFKGKMDQTLLSETFGTDFLRLGIPDELFYPNLETGNTERFDLELQHQLRLLSDLRAVWGMGLRQDRGASEVLFNTTASLADNLWRLFANLEWRASKRLVWNLGAMTEHHDSAGIKTSPRLALNLQLNRHHMLRASYTLAYRMPSLLASNQNTRWTHSNGTPLAQLLDADPNLQPEKNRTLELGYLGIVPALKLDIDLKLFHEQVTRGLGTVFSIDPLPLNTVTRISSNNSHWRASGLETQLKLRPTPHFWIALQYAYLDIEGLSSDGKISDVDQSIVDQNLSEMSPRHSLSLLANQQLNQNWDLSLNFYQQSATGFFSGSMLDSFRRLDTRLAKTWKRRKTETQIALVMQNLLNEDYAEFQQRNQFDRRAYLSLSLQFL
ncbi:MAG: TonB-dependent receptor [Motiliproteus sp.]